MTSTVSVADRLGIEPGMVVQELGRGKDSDEVVWSSAEERTGTELLDANAEQVVDMVLLWWREDDGDLVDALVDATGQLAENGVIWVLAPKAGRDGYVEPADIAEAVPMAGLAQTSSLSISGDWTGLRLVSPKTTTARR
jgi:hypothetical protein